MKTRGRPKKNPFDLLTSEERDTLSSLRDDELRNRIAKAAMDCQALEDAQKLDGDLALHKEVLRCAVEPYREGRKRLRQLVRYSRSVLDGRGQEAGTSPTEGIRQAS